ncbi:MAG: hypothetical protein LBJ12_08785 [Oscillospiraceae bacterium]|nr:hypothetical protein [Oscillospiraceae bacterium]
MHFSFLPKSRYLIANEENIINTNQIIPLKLLPVGGGSPGLPVLAAMVVVRFVIVAVRVGFVAEGAMLFGCSVIVAAAVVTGVAVLVIGTTAVTGTVVWGTVVGFVVLGDAVVSVGSVAGRVGCVYDAPPMATLVLCWSNACQAFVPVIKALSTKRSAANAVNILVSAFDIALPPLSAF